MILEININKKKIKQTILKNFFCYVYLTFFEVMKLKYIYLNKTIVVLLYFSTPFFNNIKIFELFRKLNFQFRLLLT